MRAVLVVLMAVILCASVQGAAMLSKVSVPSDSELVFAVSQAVRDDIDTSAFGPWAIDDYTILTAVWKRADGSHFALITHAGTWQTFKGMPSPGSGKTQLADGNGTFLGTQLIDFETSGCAPIMASLLPIEMRATKEDLISKTSSTQTISHILDYCDEVSSFSVRNEMWKYWNGDETYFMTPSGEEGDILI